MPISLDLINRELVTIDREQAFLLYATFCGDIERTAHSLNISPATVLKVVEDEGWNKKLASIIELKKSNRAGDLERSLNRAMNFVQAHQFRLFVQRVIRRVTGMSDDELEEYLLTGYSKEGKHPKLSTRALADLASALEKCHAMSYLALNDTAQERIKRNEIADAGEAAGDLHARIAKAMSEAGASASPRAQLFDAQLAAAQEIAAAAQKPSPGVPKPIIDDTYEQEG